MSTGRGWRRVKSHAGRTTLRSSNCREGKKNLARFLIMFLLILRERIRLGISENHGKLPAQILKSETNYFMISGVQQLEIWCGLVFLNASQ